MDTDKIPETMTAPDSNPAPGPSEDEYAVSVFNMGPMSPPHPPPRRIPQHPPPKFTEYFSLTPNSSPTSAMSGPSISASWEVLNNHNAPGIDTTPAPGLSGAEDNFEGFADVPLNNVEKIGLPLPLIVVSHFLFYRNQILPGRPGFCRHYLFILLCLLLFDFRLRHASGCFMWGLVAYLFHFSLVSCFFVRGGCGGRGCGSS